MTATIFIGIQASGKSTFYKKYFEGKSVYVNLDTLRTRNKERLLIEECINNKKDFVVDNTNPTKEDRQRYIEVAKENKYRVVGYYFESNIANCVERNNQREGKARIPSIAIASTYNKLVLPEYSEGFDELYYVKITAEGFSIDEWSVE